MWRRETGEKGQTGRRTRLSEKPDRYRLEPLKPAALIKPLTGRRGATAGEERWMKIRPLVAEREPERPEKPKGARTDR